MKRVLVFVLAAVAQLGGAADAADLRVPKASPVLRPACAQFGGFYVGANGGWAYHDATWVDRDAWVDTFSVDFSVGSVSSTRNGGTAGVQAGLNWQRGCTLFGVEIDANWTGLSSSKSYAPTESDPVETFTVLTLEHDVRWFGTARTRTGLIVDDLLLFVTGGFAYANIGNEFTVTDPRTDPTVEAFSAKNERWGWVGGVGAEWAWSPSISIKSEVLYIRFAEVETTGVSAVPFSSSLDDARTVAFDHRDSMWVSRIGINFRFGEFGKGPVAAKY